MFLSKGEFLVFINCLEGSDGSWRVVISTSRVCQNKAHIKSEKPWVSHFLVSKIKPWQDIEKHKILLAAPSQFSNNVSWSCLASNNKMQDPEVWMNSKYVHIKTQIYFYAIVNQIKSRKIFHLSVILFPHRIPYRLEPVDFQHAYISMISWSLQTKWGSRKASQPFLSLGSSHGPLLRRNILHE